MTFAQWLKQYHASRDAWLVQNDKRFGRLLTSLRQKVQPDSTSGISGASKTFTEDYHSLMEDQLESSAQLETKGGLLQAHPFLVSAGIAGLSTAAALSYFSDLPKEIAQTQMEAKLPDGLTLSERIWNLDYSQDITRMVENGLLNHLNPEQIASQLDGFLLPGREVTTLTPYGRSLNFDAMRLARTEVMKSAAETQKEVLQNTPWITGLLWDAEGEKPCDECEGYAGEVYAEGEVPDYPPHPQCECVLVPQTMPNEEWDAAMSDFLETGKDDIGIADWMAE